eukprot:756695-Hanusia_phi.AAC.5
MDEHSMACVPPFPCQPVQRISFDDPAVIDFLRREEPVILSNVSLVRPLVGRWNVDYLKENFPHDFLFTHVDWGTVYGWKAQLGFGDLTTNLLLVGTTGHVTPAHYDEQHNFFCQLQGRKCRATTECSFPTSSELPDMRLSCILVGRGVREQVRGVG